jgi:hypothetical protein
MDMDHESPKSKASSAADLSSKYSCLVCHRRKVKCDRAQPCSHCVRNKVACNYVAPPAPRRKRKKGDQDLLAEKVMRYEEQLRGMGVTVDEQGQAHMPHNLNLSPASTIYGSDKHQRTGPSSSLSSERTVPVFRSSEHRVHRITSSEKGRAGSLMLNAGKARFVDNNLWMTISDELPDSGRLLQDQPDNSTEEDDWSSTDTNPNSILFHGRLTADVASLYPPPAAVMTFWTAFCQNVDPLTKIVHIPTLQTLVEVSCHNVRSLSRYNLTLLFSIHLISVESMTDEQCRAATGESKRTLFKRLLAATQQCFVRGCLLRTGDLTMLTALLFYLLAIRCSTDAQTVYTLMAIAIRISQRIGLHKDITSGLRPYDIEMRRRVWKQVLLQEWSCSEVAGITSGHEQSHGLWMSPNPRNINDCDFDMSTTHQNYPISSDQPTDMVLVQMRYNFARFFIGTSAAMEVPGADKDEIMRTLWSEAGMSSECAPATGHDHPGGPVADRDRVIDFLEMALQDKYLRYLDPINPMHSLVAIIARSAVVSMRIRAHHPRQYADGGASLPQEELDKIFDWSVQAIQYDNLFFTNPVLERFRWHSRQLFQHQPLIYLLISIGSRRNPSDPGPVFRSLDTLFDNRPELLERKQALHVAIGVLAVRAWDAYESELIRQNRPYKAPEFIMLLRRMGPPKESRLPRPEPPEAPSNPRTNTSSSILGLGPMGNFGDQPLGHYGVAGDGNNHQANNNNNNNNWRPPQTSYGGANSTQKAVGMDTSTLALWAQWDQLVVNPDLPFNAGFSLNEFTALDGFFAPMKNG